MRYLLDTCIVSYFLKKYPNTIRNLEKHNPSTMAISVITIYEIEFGLKNNPDKERKLRDLWERFINKINILDLNTNTAIEASKISASLRKRGFSVGSYDLLIAATAMSEDLICVTSNITEFSRIADLHLEDWNK